MLSEIQRRYLASAGAIGVRYYQNEMLNSLHRVPKSEVVLRSADGLDFELLLGKRPANDQAYNEPIVASEGFASSFS